MLPTVLALILCDNFHRDGHGKPYLLGVFNQFFSAEYPGVLRKSWLYLSLTGAHGEVKVALRLVDAAELDAKPVVTRDVLVKFNNPLDVPEPVLQIEAIAFPKPGVYVWQVVCAGR